jgi:hypothetical protein
MKVVPSKRGMGSFGKGLRQCSKENGQIYNLNIAHLHALLHARTINCLLLLARKHDCTRLRRASFLSFLNDLVNLVESVCVRLSLNSACVSLHMDEREYSCE